jgi:hypothetical protein
MTKNNECGGCFYEEADHRDAPCRSCWESSKYVHRDVFKDVSDSPVFWSKQSDKLSWKFNPADALRETFSKSNYDTVSKPKHYMLFEDKGIEVRDVIEKLMQRVYTAYNEEGNTTVPYAPMFDSDYVQMMQYLMRFMDKNGSEDLKKARWYLDKMIDAYE